MFQHNTSRQLIECRRCMSPKLIKYGVTCSLGQRYKCQTCGRSFTIGGKRKQYTAFEKKQVLRFAQDRSIRKAAKLYHLSPNTIRKRRDLSFKEDTTTAFVNANTMVAPNQNYNRPYMDPNCVVGYTHVMVS